MGSSSNINAQIPKKSSLALGLCFATVIFPTAQHARTYPCVHRPVKYYRSPHPCDAHKYRLLWTALFIYVMSTTSESPLRNLRLAALALCAAWCIISSSIGLNALIKFVPLPCSLFVDLFVTWMNIGPIGRRRVSARRPLKG